MAVFGTGKHPALAVEEQTPDPTAALAGTRGRCGWVGTRHGNNTFWSFGRLLNGQYCVDCKAAGDSRPLSAGP